MTDLRSLDIPPVLLNMLEHLLNTYGHIKSWNIYENNAKGLVHVNIRFDDILCEVDGHSGHARTDPVAYRRLSTKQLDRNRLRANKWNDNKQTHTPVKNGKWIILLRRLIEWILH